jgi:hypothetical protein
MVVRRIPGSQASLRLELPAPITAAMSCEQDELATRPLNQLPFDPEWRANHGTEISSCKLLLVASSPSVIHATHTLQEAVHFGHPPRSVLPEEEIRASSSPIICTCKYLARLLLLSPARNY